MEYLFDPHHGFHVLGSVPHRQTAETAIPAHQVVVDVASHQAKHVAKIRLMLGNDGRGNPCCSHR